MPQITTVMIAAGIKRPSVIQYPIRKTVRPARTKVRAAVQCATCRAEVSQHFFIPNGGAFSEIRPLHRARSYLAFHATLPRCPLRANCAVSSYDKSSKQNPEFGWGSEAAIQALSLAKTTILITRPGAHPSRTEQPIGGVLAHNAYRLGPSGAA